MIARQVWLLPFPPNTSNTCFQKLSVLFNWSMGQHTWSKCAFVLHKCDSVFQALSIFFAESFQTLPPPHLINDFKDHPGHLSPKKMVKIHVQMPIEIQHVELINDLLLLISPRTWLRRTRGQLKTWATTIKVDLEFPSWSRVFGYARWRKDCVKVSSEPRVPPSETWSIHMVMPAQHAPGEDHQKCKYRQATYNGVVVNL